ncbi:hypothetical protein [Flavobacterium sp. 102]|uniref:hypothetical protein n=1 Tax=Flavobacterium sp. 102 TaxID=2135623 RepID=UPI000EAE2972|nr:hypothetical protein [Flavobacterium sp. 102]RKS01984.1 hypothetical protein C8C84_1673 [Flavobacterium sp. 102]
MKKIVLLLAILIGHSVSAQIKVKVNDKLVTEGTSFKAEDISKMELAFDKPKKLSYYGLGRLYFWVEILKESGNSYEDYRIAVDGANAIEAFLMDVNDFKTFYADGKVSFNFKIRSSSKQLSLPELFLLAGRWADQKTLKIRVSLFFRDKVGYEKYGDAVELVKPLTINVDNAYFYAQGQKEKEAEKVAADTKKAEDVKKAEEQKKAAEEEEKKGKGKKVLKKVLGW